TDLPDFWSLTRTCEPIDTTSLSAFFSSTTVALRSLSSSAEIRASSMACSFLAWSYSAFSAMSPNSRASFIRSATSRRFSVRRNSISLFSLSKPSGVRTTSLGIAPSPLTHGEEGLWAPRHFLGTSSLFGHLVTFWAPRHYLGTEPLVGHL